MDWAPLWRGPSSPANQILRLSRFARFARLASVLVGNAATPAVITKRLELSTKVARTTRSHLSAFSALANEPRAVSAQLRLTVAATRANWRDRTESERLGKISALVIGLGSVATLLILLVSLSCGATELVALGGAVADVVCLAEVCLYSTATAAAATTSAVIPAPMARIFPPRGRRCGACPPVASGGWSGKPAPGPACGVGQGIARGCGPAGGWIPGTAPVPLGMIRRGGWYSC